MIGAGVGGYENVIGYNNRRFESDITPSTLKDDSHVGAPIIGASRPPSPTYSPLSTKTVEEGSAEALSRGINSNSFSNLLLPVSYTLE